MKDKVCLITGSTSGIGRSTAFRLANLGATVVLLCRNAELGKKTIEEIKQKTENANVDMLVADLSSQEAIRKSAADFSEKYRSLSVLINNAGLAGKRTLSQDGIEMTFAVNHLGYFLLTNLLLDRLKASAPARIINVSSEAHRNAKIDFNNLQMEKEYTGWRAYCLSKLCNLLFTYELARKLEGSGVTANALHPGFLNTGIFRETPAVVRFIVKLIAGSAEKGAKAVVHLATSPELANISGKYFNRTQETLSSEGSYNREDAERLWKISEEMTGL